jgi:hypothetical protein
MKRFGFCSLVFAAAVLLPAWTASAGDRHRGRGHHGHHGHHGHYGGHRHGGFSLSIGGYGGGFYGGYGGYYGPHYGVRSYAYPRYSSYYSPGFVGGYYSYPSYRYGGYCY